MQGTFLPRRIRQKIKRADRSKAGVLDDFVVKENFRGGDRQDQRIGRKDLRSQGLYRRQGQATKRKPVSAILADEIFHFFLYDQQLQISGTHSIVYIGEIRNTSMPKHPLQQNLRLGQIPICKCDRLGF